MSDLALLQRWTDRRDAQAFKEIVSRYAPMVYATCTRILGSATEGEDVTQECFEVLAGTHRKPTEHLGAWLHQVATNRALDKVRAEQRRVAREANFAAGRPSQVEIKWDDIYEHVDEAIAELPEELRIPVVAHFLQDESHAEVARAIGVPRRTVSRRIARAIELMENSLRRRGVTLSSGVLASLMAANLAEAAAVPAPLAAALGKLSLAHCVNPVVPSLPSAVATARFVGGLLIMKKTIAMGLVLLLVVFIVVNRLHHPSKEVLEEAVYPEEWKPTVVAVAPQESPASNLDATSTAQPDPVTGPQSAIRGRVFDLATDNGIAKAEVHVKPESAAMPEKPVVWTNEQGIYESRDLTEGRYSVDCIAPDGFRVARTGVTRLVSVPQRAVVEGCDFALLPEAPLAGMVVDEAGQAVAEAAVEVKAPGLLRTATTKADGSFVFRALAPQKSACLAARKGPLVSVPYVFQLPSEGVTDIVLQMVPGASVSGRVVNAGGKPAADIWVAPFSRDKNVMTVLPKGISDTSGQFSVSPLPAGEYDLQLRKARTSAYWGGEGTYLHLAQGEHKEGLVLVYERSFSISGRVLFENGDPVADAVVSARKESFLGGITGSQSEKTTEDGSFNILDLPQGKYDVRAYDSKTKIWSEPVPNVPTGAKNLNLTILSGTRVAVWGRVLDINSKQPLRLFSAALVSTYASPSNPDTPFIEFSDPQGRFRLESSENKPCVLVVTAPGYVPSTKEIDLGHRGARKEEIVLLQGGNNVHGVVTNTAGQVVSDVGIFVGSMEASRRGTPSATTDAKGAFTLEGLPFGQTLITAYHPDYALTETTVSVRSGTSPDVQIVLSAGGCLQGMVQWPDWDLGGATVSIAYPSGHDAALHQCPIQNDGSYRIERLMPGRALLQVAVLEPDSGFVHVLRKDIDIATAEDTTVDLIVPPASGWISGRVDPPPDGNGPIDVSLRISTEYGEQEHRGLLGSDHAFVFSHIPEGRVLIEAEVGLQLGGTASISQELDVGPAQAIQGLILSFE